MDSNKRRRTLNFEQEAKLAKYRGEEFKPSNRRRYVLSKEEFELLNIPYEKTPKKGVRKVKMTPYRKTQKYLPSNLENTLRRIRGNEFKETKNHFYYLSKNEFELLGLEVPENTFDENGNLLSGSNNVSNSNKKKTKLYISQKQGEFKKSFEEQGYKVIVTDTDEYKSFFTDPIEDSQKDEVLNDYAESNGIPKENIKRYWKNRRGGISAEVLNPLHDDELKVIKEFKKILTKFSNLPKTKFKEPKYVNNFALNIFTSDDHVGMKVENDSNIFNYKYNAKIYSEKRKGLFDNIVKKIESEGYPEVIYLNNLGDQADGWNGKTTRQSNHDLPQNMTNDEVFKCVVTEKLLLIKRLVDYTDGKIPIIMNSVCNDNHSGTFSEVINSSVEMMCNVLYDKKLVRINKITDFYYPYSYGNHTFILTHGKDKHFMKRGLPYFLNKDAEIKILHYLKHNNIENKHIHICKGDLHQIGYQPCEFFEYRNYGSFAPPSGWVQGNFGNSKSSYNLQIVEKYGNVKDETIFIDYKTK